jgi:hypothetical protein
MGRALDNPWTLLILLLVLLTVAAFVLVFTLTARSARGRHAAAPMPPVYPGAYPAAPMVHPGQSHASNALVFGVIGIFILGIVFGPLALGQANKAESFGVPATAGKVLGAISLVFGILGALGFVLYLSMAI